MSIKFLQDQQLNQIQRSPMDSPWAKLVAQSEMLDRNKLRQPQGQAPQGTVADDIQQALIAAQQNQAQQMQNVPLDKAQLIAQLVNSGHFAAGGLTQSSPYSQMMGSSPYSAAGHTPTYIPPESQDAAAQAKKHGMLQSMLDNSIVGMAQGKANIGNALQDYLDFGTGKMFSRGFAQGGTIAEQLTKAVGANPPSMGNLSPEEYIFKYFPNATTEEKTRILSDLKASIASKFNERYGAAPIEESAPISEAIAEPFVGPRTRGESMASKMADKGYQGYTRTPPAPDEMLQKMGASFRTQQEAEAARAAKAQQAADALAKQQAAKEAWLGEAVEREVPTKGLGSLTKGVLGAAGDLAAVQEVTGNPLPLFLKAAGVNVPSNIGGVSTSQGSPSQIAMDLFSSPTTRLRRTGEELSDIGQHAANLSKAELEHLAAIKSRGGMKSVLENIGERTRENITEGSKKIGEGAKEYLSSYVVDPAKRFWSGDYDAVAGLGLSSLGTPVGQTTQQPVTQATTTPTGTPTTPTQQPVAQATATPTETPATQTTPPATPPTATPTAPQTSSVANNTTVNKVASTTKHPSTGQNTEVRDRIFNQTPAGATDDLGKKVDATSALQQTIQAVSKSAGEEGQGSILDSLYNKLKDTDVDYSDLAKRISQNEYDLARERKDGTFNAILGGIGAALKQAGTYEEAGGRVFRPGIGAIAGSGILGGLKLSEEADKKYAEGNQNNTLALLKLKELKGKSLNDVLDAISAQQQTQAIARGQEITRAHNAATSEYQMGSLDVDRQNAATNAGRALSDEAYKAALIANSTNVMNKQDKFFADELDKEITGLISELTSDKFPDKTSAEYQDKAERLRLARAKKDVLLRKYGLADVEAALGIAGGQPRQNFAKNVTKTPINPGN